LIEDEQNAVNSNIKTRMKTQILSCMAALAFAAASIFNPSRASAFITIYTDAAAWQAAVGSFVTEPFDATGLQSFTQANSPSGGIGPASGVLSGSVGGDDIYNNTSFYSATTFSYKPGQLLGAGATWDTSPNGDGSGIDIFLNGGSESVGHIGGIHGSFFGWTSSTPFNSFVLEKFFQAQGGEVFNIDNLKFAPVPEPCSATILALGMIGLWVTCAVR
jgi:hypothetical protein